MQGWCLVVWVVRGSTVRVSACGVHCDAAAGSPAPRDRDHPKMR